MKWLDRPLIMLGHGIRAAGCADLAPMLLNLGLPVASSWLGKDLVDNGHPNFLGCTGIYGNRAANLAFSKADQILAIGNRLCVWNAGDNGLNHKPEVYSIIDPDISYEIRQVLEPTERMDWLAQCRSWHIKYPWLEHEDTEGYINSYNFTAELHTRLRLDEIIVTDMGAPLMSAFQVLKIKPPQRLITSGGLGEMGCGLPAAIGACFAGAKRVICLNADGSMMLNLQELQTIVHHKLPIKIIVYDNKGYGMIKQTQYQAKMPQASVNAASGVSFPDYTKLAETFGLSSGNIEDWDDFDFCITRLLDGPGPGLIAYHMDPEQPFVPKLQSTAKGFWDLSPTL